MWVCGWCLVYLYCRVLFAVVTDIVYCVYLGACFALDGVVDALSLGWFRCCDDLFCSCCFVLFYICLF